VTISSAADVAWLVLVCSFLGGLFVNSVVEVVHHSEIFSPVRRLILRCLPYAGKAVTCPFCFSFWVGWFYWVMVWVSMWAWVSLRLWWCLLWIVPVGGFISARIAQLINDLCYPYLKTIRHDYADYEAVLAKSDDPSTP